MQVPRSSAVHGPLRSLENNGLPIFHKQPYNKCVSGQLCQCSATDKCQLKKAWMAVFQ